MGVQSIAWQGPHTPGLGMLMLMLLGHAAEMCGCTGGEVQKGLQNGGQDKGGVRGLYHQHLQEGEQEPAGWAS